MPSRGPTCGQSGDITPALSTVPNAQHRDKIRIGYFTLAIGVQMWAKWLHNTCLLGVPNKRTKSEAAAKTPWLLGGPQRGDKNGKKAASVQGNNGPYPLFQEPPESWWASVSPPPPVPKRKSDFPLSPLRGAPWVENMKQNAPKTPPVPHTHHINTLTPPLTKEGD